MIARSLAELLRHKGKVTELYLKRSADLVCNNLFCEKVTKPCLCRLERALEHSNPVNLEVLDLSGNGLEALPPSVLSGRMPKLRVLDLSENSFTSVPAELSKLTGVQIILKIADKPGCESTYL